MEEAIRERGLESSGRKWGVRQGRDEGNTECTCGQVTALESGSSNPLPASWRQHRVPSTLFPLNREEARVFTQQIPIQGAIEILLQEPFPCMAALNTV